ncbi:hypothetical protein DL769_008747 [Monosporascus sp. CRB-8-3]|nr:hypothetical protein DL769_008747 [Monosporascus sp. CRB-8-3]
MYRELFEVRRWMYGAVWIGLIFSFAIYFPSIPLSAIYEAPKPGQSWEELLLSLASSESSSHALVYWGIVQGTSSVVLDLYIFILPLPTLSKLHLPMGKKLQLLALFGTALLGVAASVAALVFRVRLLYSEDSTWEQARLAICVVVENNVAIIVGCMPIIANFMRLHMAELSIIRSMRTKLRGSSNNHSYESSKVMPSLPNGTFGSPNMPRRPPHQYYELTDSVLMQTQITVTDEDRLRGTNKYPNQGDAGIVRTCLALSALLGERKVAVPGSSTYNLSLDSYFSAQQSAIHPACIVSPETAQDVSATVAWLTTKGNSCHFAVRSGGHTSWAGASNIAGGVVIDLRTLGTVELSADKSTVLVGAGATWDAVYAKLDPLGLSVNGGRAAGVGVGGLTLGGGISYFSPRYGWTCDVVSNFQVVLADGRIVDANATSNPDLFVALKGGNNNFGIVTRIDLATFEQGLIWAGTVYNALSSVDDIIAEFVKLNSRDAYDEYASFITTFGYSQAQGMAVISNQLEYTKEVENPPIYKGYLSQPSLRNTAQLMNMTTLAKATAALQPVNARALYRVSTLVSTAAVLKAAFNHWNASVPAITSVSNIVWALVLEPLPPAIYARSARYNALGLADRTEPLVVVLLSTTWSDARDDQHVAEAANALMDAVNQEARQLGAFDPYVYLDYAGQHQDPIASYGAESVNRLRQVRQRVDPKEVFTFQVPGGYKIPDDKYV